MQISLLILIAAISVSVICVVFCVMLLCGFPGGNTGICFQSKYSVPESLSRLSSVCLPYNSDTLVSEWLVGSVKTSSVTLQRRTRGMKSSFNPVFTGRFKQQDGQVVLSGKFAMAPNVQVFLALWIVGIISIFALCVFVLVSEHNQGALEGIAISGIMLTFGIWLVRTGKSSSADDIAWLKNNIKNAVQT
ncbi:hypothetical protein [Glaciimonas soli]|uniref:Uncharacterized protein n=1 Tax=Glaciimonas soli TaxID=2590999 RepID=A0A843YS06_9BURK|nr:hypothetical protein [Glaciimonas soli]MQR00777.1 hypothetical protein [Glaciimonas soli]